MFSFDYREKLSSKDIQYTVFFFFTYEETLHRRDALNPKSIRRNVLLSENINIFESFFFQLWAANVFSMNNKKKTRIGIASLLHGFPRNGKKENKKRFTENPAKGFRLRARKQFQ